MFAFKAKIKEMSKLKNKQQEVLAPKMGITIVGVFATLGKDNPQLGSMENITDALGVSLVEQPPLWR